MINQYSDIVSDLAADRIEHLEVAYASLFKYYQDALDLLKQSANTKQEPVAISDALASADYVGWYCAHCNRAVDASEVTYHEQCTECGRVITNDVPPRASAQPTNSDVWDAALEAAAEIFDAPVRAELLNSDVCELIRALKSTSAQGGDLCGRNNCDGSIETHAVEDCSCHISPPCSACTSPRNFCPSCGWEESDDQIVNDYVVQVDRKTGIYKSWEPRPLDPTKLDYHSKPHSSSSMIKEGFYPIGMPIADVLMQVKGTFGGRFEYFRDGKFKYVAYTD